MTKKRNYENEEEFKNFNLEDYLPSMNSRKSEETTSIPEQESTVEEGANIFPPLDEPDTSAIQVAVSKDIRPDEQEVLETSDADEEVKEPSTGIVAASERTIVRRISSKQRRLSLDEYRTTYLQVPKIADRKPVFVSREVRDELDRIVRCLGGRGMSVSGLVENLSRQHLVAYRNDIEQWRKL
ncbi:DUF3408 domain-containing protein [Parabacteroides distasonis]|uniref:DUF3408 domain-containing protein n=1 Tax=Parabacteroides distasonis TaxID=823 RepID=UPI0018A01B26|nr:DUF3408 domain-containing protein [Parabacteroides distasonis]MDB9154183.1 DUF3408 domain-containing protein [Parabacteroides distasonis]MDB9158764.1 DUF3408 domain-containing protein [Parabacteroides distasonis]MDB9167488.1 DUF3408 domain-containing protein [Parabacteroides distasonis]MDB9171998.1 DUF3408 domain-containing protein [Parabacteroides distasonis]MDB9195367.1 DUF3408 domain-containing protein [Parabacteroides distasonis]